MTDRFVIQLDAEGTLLDRINSTLQQLQRPGDLMDSIGAVLERNVNLRFDTKRDPTGAAWAPLSPRTVKIYERKYKGSIPGSLLERSRHMRSTLAYNAGEDWAEVGFSDPKAIYHETGTKSKKGNPKMPRRGLLTANPELGELGAGDRDDVIAEVEAWLAGTLFG